MSTNVENIRKWVEALRSGRYKQGAGALHMEGGTYCCLGVACDISGLGAWEPPRSGDDRFGYAAGTGVVRVYLAPEVIEWLGVEEDCPTVNGRVLASLNDDGTAFPEIADLIEAEWLPEATS